jgi:Luciferase-like monooxygenase
MLCVIRWTWRSMRRGGGYRGFWLAEHHNMVCIANAATAVVISSVAAGTRTIRVGAGGIMLPNHSPLVIAEQFGTLATLHPGRIDLGLGRAPGTDQRTLLALRRDPMSVDRFPQLPRTGDREKVIRRNAFAAILRKGEAAAPRRGRPPALSPTSEKRD